LEQIFKSNKKVEVESVSVFNQYLNVKEIDLPNGGRIQKSKYLNCDINCAGTGEKEADLN